jgi:antitoxin (DNA-binding transcriptional repressor) of toxin-antitoxin stability system
MYMAVNITEFRRNLFRLADQALEGKPIEFIHKGVVFKVVPETPVLKLSKLTRETVVAPGVSLDTSELLKEMEAEWEKDWSEI